MPLLRRFRHAGSVRGPSGQLICIPFGSFTSSPPSALTTTKPRPASAMTTMKRIATETMMRRGLAEFGAGDLGERFAAAPHRGRQHEHVLHRAGQTDADHQPEQAGHVAVLDRQHRADQRAGPGDRGEVMAEQHPLVGRMIVLPIVELMRRRRSQIVEHRHLRGQESAVIAIGDGEDAQDAEQERHRPQDRLPLISEVKSKKSRATIPSTTTPTTASVFTLWSPISATVPVRGTLRFYRGSPLS